jgi:hypothetical protein
MSTNALAALLAQPCTAQRRKYAVISPAMYLQVFRVCDGAKRGVLVSVCRARKWSVHPMRQRLARWIAANRPTDLKHECFRTRRHLSRRALPLVVESRVAELVRSHTEAEQLVSYAFVRSLLLSAHEQWLRETAAPMATRANGHKRDFKASDKLIRRFANEYDLRVE